jgi:hypothetical protein
MHYNPKPLKHIQKYSRVITKKSMVSLCQRGPILPLKYGDTICFHDLGVAWLGRRGVWIGHCIFWASLKILVYNLQSIAKLLFHTACLQSNSISHTRQTTTHALGLPGLLSLYQLFGTGFQWWTFSFHWQNYIKQIFICKIWMGMEILILNWINKLL